MCKTVRTLQLHTAPITQEPQVDHEQIGVIFNTVFTLGNVKCPTPLGDPNADGFDPIPEVLCHELLHARPESIAGTVLRNAL